VLEEKISATMSGEGRSSPGGEEETNHAIWGGKKKGPLGAKRRKRTHIDYRAAEEKKGEESAARDIRRGRWERSQSSSGCWKGGGIDQDPSLWKKKKRNWETRCVAEEGDKKTRGRKGRWRKEG